MAQISIDNGHSFCTVEEALKAHSIEKWAEYMDDATREVVHKSFAGSTDTAFMKAYLELANNDLIIG